MDVSTLTALVQRIGRELEGDEELGPREIADAIWLSVQLGEAPAPSRPFRAPERSPQPLPNLAPMVSGPEGPATTAQDTAEPLGLPPPPAAQPRPSRPGEALAAFLSPDEGRAPTALPLDRPLRQRRAIARALRPLCRRVPSRIHTELDILASVEHSAIARTPTIIVSPARERWLDLALVVDASPTVAVWHDWIDDLARFLAGYGAFRDVRTWTLHHEATENGEAAPFLRVRTRGHDQRRRRVEELNEPSGRRLILVLSDCINHNWAPDRFPGVLALWARQSRVTLLQLLPTHLWQRSLLGSSPLTWVRSSEPTLALQKLHTDGLSTHRRNGSVPVPITSALNPAQLARWVRIIAGVRTDRTIRALWCRRPKGPANPAQAPFVRPKTARQEEKIPAVKAQPKDEEAEQQRLLQAFRANASAPARRLATRFAYAGTLELPVMRLIQRDTSGADESHLAEVVLSGLLVNTPGPNRQTRLSFASHSVAEQLKREGGPGDGVRVALKLGDYYGVDIRAYLDTGQLPPTADPDQQNKGLALFLKIMRDDLKRLGPLYANLVQQIEERFPPIPPPPPPPYDSNAIHWLAQALAEQNAALALISAELLLNEGAQLYENQSLPELIAHQIDALTAPRMREVEGLGVALGKAQTDALNGLNPAPLTELLATWRSTIASLEPQLIAAQLLATATPPAEASAPPTPQWERALERARARIADFFTEEQRLTRLQESYQRWLDELNDTLAAVSTYAAQAEAIRRLIATRKLKGANQALAALREKLKGHQSATLDELQQTINSLTLKPPTPVSSVDAEEELHRLFEVAKTDFASGRYDQARAAANKVMDATDDPNLFEATLSLLSQLDALLVETAPSLVQEAERLVSIGDWRSLQAALANYERALSFPTLSPVLRQEYNARYTRLRDRANQLNAYSSAQQVDDAAQKLVYAVALMSQGQTTDISGRSLAAARESHTTEVLEMLTGQVRRRIAVAAGHRSDGLNQLYPPKIREAIERLRSSAEPLDGLALSLQRSAPREEDVNTYAAVIARLANDLQELPEVLALRDELRRELQSTQALLERVTEARRLWQQALRAEGEEQFAAAKTLLEQAHFTLEESSETLTRALSRTRTRWEQQEADRLDRQLFEGRRAFAGGDLSLARKVAAEVAAGCRTLATERSEQLLREANELAEQADTADQVIQSLNASRPTSREAYERELRVVREQLGKQPQSAALRAQNARLRHDAAMMSTREAEFALQRRDPRRLREARRLLEWAESLLSEIDEFTAREQLARTVSSFLNRVETALIELR